MSSMFKRSSSESWTSSLLSAGLYHAMNHTLFKGLLFLCAGAVLHETGTTDLDKLGGLSKKMPHTTVLFLVGAFSISGIPPFNGFASKWMIYQAAFLKGVYDGINIKLMKCGGLRNAHKMVELARGLGLKVMLGCMTETSCAVTAAANLSPVVDYADLDGNLLIANDRFTGMTVENGKITLHDRPGLGIELLK